MESAWTQTQLLAFATAWSAGAAVGVLLLKGKWPPLPELIGTVLLHGTVGGSFGFFAYDAGGLVEKSIGRLWVVSSSYGAGFIAAKSWLTNHGFIKNGNGDASK